MKLLKPGEMVSLGFIDWEAIGLNISYIKKKFIDNKTYNIRMHRFSGPGHLEIDGNPFLSSKCEKYIRKNFDEEKFLNYFTIFKRRPSEFTIRFETKLYIDVFPFHKDGGSGKGYNMIVVSDNKPTEIKKRKNGKDVYSGDPNEMIMIVNNTWHQRPKVSCDRVFIRVNYR